MTINVVIPAAGTGLRKNSNKPKLLTEFVDKERLFEKQINTIREIWPDANITYIIGFNKEKLEKKLRRNDCNIVVNTCFEETNVGYSIKLGLDKIRNESCFVLYGDLFFSEQLIQYLPTGYNHSYLVKENQGNFNKKSIGIGENKYLDYSFEEKWARAFYISEAESVGFSDLMNKPRNKRKFAHEIINELIEKGNRFDVIRGSGYIKELDKFKDFNKINEWIEEKKDNNGNRCY